MHHPQRQCARQRPVFATFFIASCAIAISLTGIFGFKNAIADTPAGGLAAFSAAPEGPPPAPWRSSGLPSGEIPASRFDIVALDARRVLRVRSERSYGTLSHATPPAAGPTPWLQWEWRLDQPLAHTDLRRKDGDDAAIKVCAMFDMPLQQLGFVERNLLLLARQRSGEKLPSATLCYVWDRNLPAGTALPNIYTPRVRYLVLEAASSPLQQWRRHQRDLGADFLRSFGHESAAVPPLLAIVVGSDADNTGGNSLAYVADITLVKQ